MKDEMESRRRQVEELLIAHGRVPRGGGGGVGAMEGERRAQDGAHGGAEVPR